MADDPRPLDPPQLRTLQMVWAAVAAAPFLSMLLIAATGHLHAGARGPLPVVYATFCGMAVACAVASVALPERLVDRSRLAPLVDALEVDEVTRPAAEHGGGFRVAAATETERVFRDPRRAAEVAVRVSMAPLTLGIALGAAVSNFGVALALQGAGVVVALPFFAVALALIAWRYPSRTRVFDAFEARTGARFPR